ncbi:MAG: TonB-dependent receptor [Bacteroidota bacterium]
MKYIFFMLLNMITFVAISQRNLSGQVIDLSSDKKDFIIGATISSLEEKSIATSTTADGSFTLTINPATEHLVISYVSYYPDTIKVESDTNYYSIGLTQKSLKEITIRVNSSSRNFDQTLNLENIGLKELRSAACCNLSEAFEKNASVDVVYSDAVSGAKEIKMLGLDGYYTQVLIGNQIAIRGLNNTFGLLYIPGQWMKGISVAKGIGSVINGYESITGQINVENKKPMNSELFNLNFFGTHQGYMELNSDFSYRLSKKISTIAFLHAETHPVLNDFNKDGFADHPRYWQVNLSNQWKYQGEKFEADFGAQYIHEDRTAGQLRYLRHQDLNQPAYGIQINNRRIDINAKTGFILSEDKSIGIQYKLFRHQQNARFGFNEYNGRQYFANINFIYQTEILSHNNILRIGASFTYDNYNEELNNIGRKRVEKVPGIFMEYSFKYLDKIDLISGLRVDYNSFYGTFVSPRVHFKYSPRPDIGIRISAGKGYRSPNIFAENFGSFASSRKIIIDPNLSYESAWNYGLSVSKKFYIRTDKELVFSVDLYRTDFQKQIVIDKENPYMLRMYNLEGKSYANSLQIEGTYELYKGLTIKAAWKYDDVWIQYKEGMKRKPLLPIYKILGTVNYATNNAKWNFSITSQYYSKSRIPSTSEKPEAFQLPEYSKGYVNLLCQINYYLNKRFEIYVGAENMLNYQQPTAISDAQNPFSTNFDASLIYGPVDGVRVYAGFRYNLPYEKGKRTSK